MCVFFSVSLTNVRSRLQALFSFAYSAVDVYIQRADMENTVYEIEEVLNERCPVSLYILVFFSFHIQLNSLRNARVVRLKMYSHAKVAG